MPTKIKLLITFFVVTIITYIFYIHFTLTEYLKSIVILLIGIFMIFGLWVLPEATGKVKIKNDK